MTPCPERKFFKPSLHLAWQVHTPYTEPRITVYSDQTYANKVTLAFSRPGKPTDNAYIELFNGSLREECLNVHWFEDLTDARANMQVWKQEYNEERPTGLSRT